MKIALLSLALTLSVFAQNPVVRRVQCPAAVVGGTGDAITCTPIPAIASYVTGVEVEVFTSAANTGATTINISGLGTKAVTNVSGGIGTALVANDLRANQWVVMRYDGTQFQVMSRLGNSSGGSDIGMTITFPPPNSALAQSTAVYAMPGSWIIGVERSWYSPVACTVSSLYVALQTALTSPHTMTATVRKSVTGTMTDQALTCQVNDTSTPVNLQVCSDTTHSFTIAVGDRLSLKYQSDATSGTYIPYATLLCK